MKQLKYWQGRNVSPPPPGLLTQVPGLAASIDGMNFVLLYWGTPAVKLVDLYCNKKTQDNSEPGTPANFRYAWSEFIINDEEKKGERGERKRKERKGKERKKGEIKD